MAVVRYLHGPRDVLSLTLTLTLTLSLTLTLTLTLSPPPDSCPRTLLAAGSVGIVGVVVDITLKVRTGPNPCNAEPQP